VKESYEGERRRLDPKCLWDEGMREKQGVLCIQKRQSEWGKRKGMSKDSKGGTLTVRNGQGRKSAMDTGKTRESIVYGSTPEGGAQKGKGD